MNKELNFQSDRIRLRPYEAADVDRILPLINDEKVKQYLMPGVAWPFTRRDEEHFVERQGISNPNYSFAIERLEDGMYLGGCGFKDPDWKNRHSELGIFLGDRFTGQGYGTEAMTLLINFGFFEMNFRKLKLEVYSFNGRAIGLYEKLGFETEGVFREDLYRNGEYQDVISMALFRKIWAQPRP